MYLLIILGLPVLPMLAYYLYRRNDSLIDGEDMFKNLLTIWLIFLMTGLICSLIIYGAYEVPMLEKEAQEYCMNLGFDTFESYKGIGLFPDEIVYAKCRYVENKQYYDGGLSVDIN